MRATDIYGLGYHDLVSVIPPDAQLAPSSKIRPESRGKSPGIRYATGMWGGYNWQETQTTPSQIDTMGASVGLKADNYPAVDIDVRDATLAAVLANVVERVMPTGPVRVGAWPKRLYMFRLAPGSHQFARMQLFITYKDDRHLVEILGAGQQYLISGVHPTTGKAYEWATPLVPAAELPTITFERASELLDAIESELNMMDIECQRSGTGVVSASVSVPQESLKAQSMDALAQAVAAIPNSDIQFPSREDYIKFGYAIKAASQDDPDRGLEIFQEWASRWTAGVNDPAVVTADWGRMQGPYQVGFGWILDLAQQHGFSAASVEFTPVEVAPIVDEGAKPETRYSDLWLTNMLITRYGAHMRFVPQWGWMVWDHTHWSRDEGGLVSSMIRDICLEVSNRLAVEGATPQERRANTALAKQIASAKQFDAIQKLARVDKRVSARADDFDKEFDLLATPTGVIDLRTGEHIHADPSQMLTKRTRVAPMRGPSPLWRQYLDVATAGDKSLQEYLQRVAGYCLTGHTREQVLFFCWGPGGAGKGTYVNTLAHVFGDIARNAQMTTFTASKSDRHPTELAALAGSRMVTAQETQEGRSWDEQRIKSLTGGDVITARFLFKDEFHYEPTFKLVFTGNFQPSLQSIDSAMRRRIQLIPFTHPPAVPDTKLQEELRRAEMPAILAWAVEGAVRWYKDGLGVPAVVSAATERYFEDEDVIGRWMEECCTGAGESTSSELYESWCRWAQREGESSRTVTWFGRQLRSRGVNKEKRNGLVVYSGVSIGSGAGMVN